MDDVTTQEPSVGVVTFALIVMGVMTVLTTIFQI
jgi:hypothetical protein